MPTIKITKFRGPDFSHGIATRVQIHLCVYDLGNEVCYPPEKRNFVKELKVLKLSFMIRSCIMVRGNPSEECSLCFPWSEVS